LSMTIFELLKDSNPKEYEKINRIIDNSEKKNQMKFGIAAHKAITTYFNDFDVCNLSKRNIL